MCTEIRTEGGILGSVSDRIKFPGVTVEKEGGREKGERESKERRGRECVRKAERESGEIMEWKTRIEVKRDVESQYRQEDMNNSGKGNMEPYFLSNFL